MLCYTAHQIHTWIPCRSHTSTHPPRVTVPPHTTTFPLFHNSHVLTQHHARTTPIPCASRHTSPQPHMSHTCHHKPAPMPTPLTWPAARGTLRHLCHLSFFTQGCCQVPGEGAAALLRLMTAPSSRETPSQSTLPQHLPFI